MSENSARYTVKYRTPSAIARALAREVERLSDNDAAFQSPQPEVVKGLFQSQDWSQTAVAKALKTDTSTIRRWTAPVDQKQHSPIPFAEWFLLMVMAGKISQKIVRIQ